MQTFELMLKIATLIISILVLIKGILEYTKAQKWKVAEFVSKEVKEFYANTDVQRAFLLLDWNDNYLELKESEMEGEKKLHFNDALILTSLHTHREMSTFSKQEVIIKGIFANFFDRLSMFDIYIETGLINVRVVKPYLVYWLSILADTKNDRKPSELRTQFWKYIDEYGYDKVRSLRYRLGFAIPASR